MLRLRAARCAVQVKGSDEEAARQRRERDNNSQGERVGGSVGRANRQHVAVRRTDRRPGGAYEISRRQKVNFYRLLTNARREAGQEDETRR